MVQWLSDTWASLTTSDVWVQWPKGSHPLRDTPSLVNNAPLLAFLNKIVETQFTQIFRDFTIVSVDASTGDNIVFNNANTPLEDVPQAATASGSVPIVFPAQLVEDWALVDGGTSGWGLNFASAVNQCLDLGYTEDQVVLDILVCEPMPELESELSVGKTLSDWQRSRSISDYYKKINNLVEVQREFPAVNYRYVFWEQEPTTGNSELLFDNDITWPLQEQGRADAQKALAAGPGVGMAKLHEWARAQEQRRS